MTKRILFTFDVEVFFNKCGSTKTLIYDNTSLILQTLNRNEVKGVFYIDATHYWYACQKEETRVIYYYEELIRKLLFDGHEIGLHTHPHWLDACGNDISYNFDNLQNYATGTAAKAQQVILKQVIHLFLSLINKIDPQYRLITFRAGGYCAQPYENITELFKDTDIYIDSSVVPRMKSKNDPFSFDYSDCQPSEPYRFSNDNTQPDHSGRNLELPVYSYRLSSYRRIVEKFKRVNTQDYKPFGEGSGLRFSRSFINRLMPVHKVLTTDDSNIDDISWAIQQNKVELVTLVNHPKLLSEAGLKNLTQTMQTFPSTSLSDEIFLH